MVTAPPPEGEGTIINPKLELFYVYSPSLVLGTLFRYKDNDNMIKYKTADR